MTPGKLLKFKADWEAFQDRHPKLIRYFEALAKQDAPAGTILDITVTYPDGSRLHANARMTEEDAVVLRQLQELLLKQSN